MPNRDENGAKNAECSGDFYPKAKINNKGEQMPEKELARHIGRNSGATGNTTLSIFAGSKIKQVKEPGS